MIRLSNLIILSNYGMQTIDKNHRIDLDFLHNNKYEFAYTIKSPTAIQIRAKQDEIIQFIKYLKQKQKSKGSFDVYDCVNQNDWEILNGYGINAPYRIGPIYIAAKNGYAFSSSKGLKSFKCCINK